MKKGIRTGSHWRAAALVVSALLSAGAMRAQAEPKTKVLIVITQDGSPCFSARVVIRPRGDVVGWPKGKTRIVLLTGLDGRTSTVLGAGSYRITAVDSIQNKLPADAYFKIKAGQDKPVKISLTLQYWDCAHVTCEL